MALWLPWWPTERLERVRAGRGEPPAGGTRPLVLVAASRGTDRVVAANPAAADAGVRPDMVLADARALVPGLLALPATPAADTKALTALADWCGRYSPWSAVDGDDGLLLDISGCAHLFGGEPALLDDLLARLEAFGLCGRAAAADSLGAAWAVARHGATPAVVVPPGGGHAVLAGLPVAALRLPPEVAEDLVRLGLRTVGDLYALPRAALAARFGDRLALRLDQALGREDEPLSPLAPGLRFWARLAFAEPIGHRDDITRAAAQLCAELCKSLAQAGRGARRLELALYLVDGTVKRIAIGLARPVREPAHLMRLLADRLPALEAGFGADLMTAAAPRTEPLAAGQATLDNLAPPPPGEAPGAADLADPELGRLVDRLGNRLGLVNVARLVPQQSHLPERAVRVLAPLAPLSTSAAGDWPASAGRPVYLLPAPEPVEAVAEVPDGPPVLFRWRGLAHRVRRADGPERIAPEWWREGETSAAALAVGSRDYYRLEDSRGRRFWLYRQGLYAAAGDAPAPAPRWYLHGFFA